VFAEDEESLPDGWLSHGSERHGYAPGTNSISFFWATGAANILRRGAMKETLDQDVLEGLHRMAEYMAAPNVHYTHGYESGTPGAMLLTKVVADYLASTGWTKKGIRQFLWENSRISQDVLRKSGCQAWIEISPTAIARDSLKMDPWPITSSPENIILVVAGGGHPTHSLWMQAYSPAVIGRRIDAPKAFDELLEAADRDLGSGGSACMI
jgi:hypothetical protein